MTDPDFRGRVLAEVGQNRGRVWSDVPELWFSIQREDEPLVTDMNDFSGLTHLRILDVHHDQVENLAVLYIYASRLSLRLLQQIC